MKLRQAVSGSRARIAGAGSTRSTAGELARAASVALVPVLAYAVISAVTALAAAPAPRPSWPRAVILVFERRIPVSMSQRGGVRLRELREEAVRQLRDPSWSLGLRPGDHVFVFADGVSLDDFNCMVHGSPCRGGRLGLRQLPWDQGIAAASDFVAAMLTLPERPHPLQSARARGPRGEEFLHLIYEGDLAPIDCAIRREITAPMTVGYDRFDDCPIEGVEIDRKQSRAVSRVEMSFPAQVSSALSVIQGSPVSGVVWLWALLGEKNYNRADTVNGIRQDFQRSTPVVDLFEKAASDYPLQQERTPTRLPGGLMVAGYAITSRTTQQLTKELGKQSDLVEMVLGRQKRIGLNSDLVLTTGLLGGDWRPEVDEFALTATLRPDAGGRLLSGLLEIDEAGSPAEILASVPAASGALEFHPPRTGESYRRAIRSHFWEKGTSFESRMDILVAGDDSPPPFGFPAIPSTYSVRRSIQARHPAAGTRVIAATLAAVILLCLAAFSIFRPHPFVVFIDPRRFGWAFPADRLNYEVHATISGYAHAVHRRWFAGRTRTRIRWAFFPPQTLPVRRGQRPVEVRIGDTPVSDGQWHEDVIPWRPGKLTKPSLIQFLNIRLDPSAFDSTAIAEPQVLFCPFHFEVEVAPSLPLPLRPFHDEFWAMAEIKIRSERPNPTLTVHIAGDYRRLGFATPEGGVVGAATLENMPRSNGIARDVATRISIETIKSPDCRIVFDVPGQPATYECALRSGMHLPISFALIPTGRPSGPHPREISGVISAEFCDRLTNEMYGPIRRHWQVTWLPIPARVAGLDLGTSGVRLFVENPTLKHYDLQMTFPMSAVNPGDNEELPEFPSLFRLEDGGGVTRVGARKYGVYTKGGGRLIESAKAALLAEMDGVGKNRAKADFERYVEALGSAWSAIREREGIEYSRFVLAVPWSYTPEISAWYRGIITRHFAGVALVTTVREAEAAAYFHLLRYRSVFDPNAGDCFPRDRTYRTLVVDAGAGTIDYAVIATSAPDGEIKEFSMLSREFSNCAGNRYDEHMLMHVFERENARMLVAQDWELRTRLRVYKESRLEGLLNRNERSPLLVSGEQVAPVVANSAAFLGKMETWFRPAVTLPLEKIADDFEEEKPFLDELLLAGRGLLAYGCRERIESEVRRLFSPAPRLRAITTTTFPVQDLPVAVARGALTFARKVVRIGDSDLAASRDIFLAIELSDGVVRQVRLLSAGDPRNGETLRIASDGFPKDIRRAWIIAGQPVLTDAVVRDAIGRLRTGESRCNGAQLLARWNERENIRKMSVVIDSEEHASFEEP